jgi:4-hydroxy-3-polyprenylbenzoate decarboxylase
LSDKAINRETDSDESDLKVRNYQMLKHLKSLREYIEALQTVGEIQEINQEVDLDLELAAIIRNSYEQKAPTPLC